MHCVVLDVLKEDSLESLSVTAQISFDRSSMMNSMGQGGGGFDRDQFQSTMAVSSVPVTNYLLENQIDSQQTQMDQIDANFGRGEMPGGMPGGDSMPERNDFFKDFSGFMGFDSAEGYISEISSAMNFTVVLQMLGIVVLLTLISGSVSMLFIMRYEPLKILANRD